MADFKVKFDEEAAAKRLGFTLEQYREYVNWEKEEVMGLKGKKMTVKTLIDQTKEFLDALLIPVRKEQEIGPFDQGTDLGDDYLVDAMLGAPAMVDTAKKLPVPVTLSIIFDRSGSMGWSQDGGQPIKFAKLIAYVFMRALFEHNAEREARGYRDQPIRFEIGLFEEDPKLIVSHASSARTDPKKRSSEKIIYDLVKSLEAGGGTKFSKALAIFKNRLLGNEDPLYSSPEAIRALVAVTDEQVNDTQKAEVLGLMEAAEKENANVWVAPVGSAEERARSEGVHGEDRVIKAHPLTLLAQALAAKLVLEVQEKHPEIPITHEILSFAGRSEMRSENFGPLEKIPTGTIEINKEDPLDKKGKPQFFKYFFIQKRGGREFLVWFDKNDPENSLSWERGPGGPEVPQIKAAVTLSDELFIKRILMSLYRANTIFTSLTPDRQWMVRRPAQDELELSHFDAKTGRWTQVTRSSYETMARVQETKGVYSNGQVWWKADAGNQSIEISLDGKTWSKAGDFPVNDFSLESAEFQVLNDGRLIYLNASDGTALFLEKQGQIWKPGAEMRMEEETASEKWHQHVLEVTGETGLGKDVTDLVAARLMNVQVGRPCANERGRAGLVARDRRGTGGRDLPTSGGFHACPGARRLGAFTRGPQNPG